MQDVAYPREVPLVDWLVQPDQLVEPIEVRRVLDMPGRDSGVEWPAWGQIENAEQQERGEHQRDAHFQGAANQKLRQTSGQLSAVSESVVSTSLTTDH